MSSNNQANEVSLKDKHIIFFSDDIAKVNTEKSIRVKLDESIEAEIAQNFFNIMQENQSSDFLKQYIPELFGRLGLLPDFTKLMVLKHAHQILVEDTNVVDFDKLLHFIHKLLIFMDNEAAIMEYWKLILFNINGRSQKINQSISNKTMNWYMEMISTKDLDSIEEVSKLSSKGEDKATKGSKFSDNSLLLACKMIKTGSCTSTLYVTYIDFAHLLGKMGFLEY
jgi:hypothetical protein